MNQNVTTPNSKNKGDLQTFVAIKEAILSIKNLMDINKPDVILLYKKKTQICYYFCVETLDWNEVKDEFVEELEEQYGFRQKKTIDIKEFKPLEPFMQSELEKNEKKEKRDKKNEEKRELKRKEKESKRKMKKKK